MMRSGYTFWGGRTFDHSKRLDRIRLRWFRWVDEWRIKCFRRWLADWLCYAAVRLRGDRWYVSDNCAGMPGNRAAELKQSIFERCIAQVDVSDPEQMDFVSAVDREAAELAQLAGEAWGFVWPAAAADNDTLKGGHRT